MNKQTVEFIEGSDIVPKGWRDWFWGQFSENAPFSWGDNNRTFITAQRFHNHAIDVLEMAVDDGAITKKEAKLFLDKLDKLGQTYIDLEN
jgi:hypothetical protein